MQKMFFFFRRQEELCNVLRFTDIIFHLWKFQNKVLNQSCFDNFNWLIRWFDYKTFFFYKIKINVCNSKKIIFLVREQNFLDARKNLLQPRIHLTRKNFFYVKKTFYARFVIIRYDIIRSIRFTSIKLFLAEEYWFLPCTRSIEVHAIFS